MRGLWKQKRSYCRDGACPVFVDTVGDAASRVSSGDLPASASRRGFFVVASLRSFAPGTAEGGCLYVSFCNADFSRARAPAPHDHFHTSCLSMKPKFGLRLGMAATAAWRSGGRSTFRAAGLRAGMAARAAISGWRRASRTRSEEHTAEL